jgi:hypothetical protein
VELEGVHDAVDLELLVAVRFFEDGEVAGIRGTGGVGRRRCGGGLGGERERKREQGGSEAETAHKVIRYLAAAVANSQVAESEG